MYLTTGEGLQEGERPESDRAEHGLLEREIDGPTELLWDTSETVAYLDAADDRVELDGNDVEVYEPDATSAESAEPATKRSAGGNAPPAGRTHCAPGRTRRSGPAHRSTRPPCPATPPRRR